MIMDVMILKKESKKLKVIFFVLKKIQDNKNITKELLNFCKNNEELLKITDEIKIDLCSKYENGYFTYSERIVDFRNNLIF